MYLLGKFSESNNDGNEKVLEKGRKTFNGKVLFAITANMFLNHNRSNGFLLLLPQAELEPTTRWLIVFRPG